MDHRPEPSLRRGTAQRAASTLLALVVLTTAAPAAEAFESRQGLQRLSVQPRHPHHWHELNLSIGVLPLDAFVKGLTVGGNYTLHFNHLWGWEIVRAYGVVADLESGLNSELSDMQISPTPFETVEWSATSSVVFKPLYGKFAIANRTLIFSELFLVAGVGYGWRTNSQNVVLNGGLGARIFLGTYVSLRFDVRWEGFFSGLTELHNEISLALGVSVHLG
jgi:outer membrane beta-barrel protein